MDLARNVFIAAHVDDLIMVGSSSQLYEVVGEMKQYFTMKVTHPLSATSAQTYVGARLPATTVTPFGSCRPHGTWTGMLNEHGVKSAKLVVTPALARDEDDEESEETSALKGIAVLRRVAGKSQFLAPRQARHCMRHEPSGEVHWQKLQNQTSLRRNVCLRHLCGTVDFGLQLQVQNRACTTLTVSTHSDWAGDRPTRKSVSSWVIMQDGFLISAGARTQSVIAQSSCKAEYIAATAATSEAKYIQALFLACGQRVNIHLRSDSSGAIDWCGKQKRSATFTSSGRAISFVAGGSQPRISFPICPSSRRRFCFF